MGRWTMKEEFIFRVVRSQTQVFAHASPAVLCLQPGPCTPTSAISSTFYSPNRIPLLLKVKFHYNIKVTFCTPKSSAIYAVIWICFCVNNYT